MIETKVFQLNREPASPAEDTNFLGDPNAISDQELVARTIGRDVAAFQMLIDRYQNVLNQMANRLLVTPADAQDVLQDVFLEVWTKIHSFSARSSLKTWLCQIVIYKCRNRNRSWRRWRSFIERFKCRDSSANKPSNEVDIRWSRMEAAMKQLSNNDRELLVMYYLQEIPLKELSIVLDCRENALEVRLHRARERLSKLVVVDEGN